MKHGTHTRKRYFEVGGLIMAIVSRIGISHFKSIELVYSNHIRDVFCMITVLYTISVCLTNVAVCSFISRIFSLRCFAWTSGVFALDICKTRDLFTMYITNAVL